MESVYSKKISISPSRCNYTGCLGIPGCAGYFMDVATEHAEETGIGLSTIGKEGKFWLTVKTRIEFQRMPKMSENVTLSTWTESSKGVKFYRGYSIDAHEGTIIRGRTQWAVINTISGKLVPVSEICSDDYNEINSKETCRDFSAFPEACEWDRIIDYRVLSTDIDLGGHMNNVSYLKAFESLFSTEEIKKYQVTAIEIHYKRPCYEGNNIKFKIHFFQDEGLIVSKVFAEETEIADIIIEYNFAN